MYNYIVTYGKKTCDWDDYSEVGKIVDGIQVYIMDMCVPI